METGLLRCCDLTGLRGGEQEGDLRGAEGQRRARGESEDRQPEVQLPRDGAK